MRMMETKFFCEKCNRSTEVKKMTFYPLDSLVIVELDCGHFYHLSQYMKFWKI